MVNKNQQQQKKRIIQKNVVYSLKLNILIGILMINLVFLSTVGANSKL